MRAMVHLSLTMALVLAISCVGSTVPETREFADADSGKSVTVKPKDLLKITLKGNPTTGFTWSAVAFDAKVLAPVGEPDYRPDRSGERMVGVGGVFVFRFKVLAPGKTKLELGYSRSWEKKAPEKTFFLDIEAR